jgi:hypothetical protein
MVVALRTWVWCGAALWFCDPGCFESFVSVDGYIVKGVGEEEMVIPLATDAACLVVTITSVRHADRSINCDLRLC